MWGRVEERGKNGRLEWDFGFGLGVLGCFGRASGSVGPSPLHPEAAHPTRAATKIALDPLTQPLFRTYNGLQRFSSNPNNWIAFSVVILARVSMSSFRS